MRTFKSEFVHSYKTYSFGYCNYAIREKKDLLSQIYERGYLPYTGTKEIKNTLYMARSARIDLENFCLNSENRRIARKFDDKFKKEITPLKKFNYKDKDFIEFCLNYFEKRHGKKIMPEERLITILESSFITHITSYKNTDEKIIAYVFEVSDKDITHFWFSFFDLEYAYKSLGMWLMIDSARHAQSSKKKYLYIGTVYGEKALYKTNFDFLEYWDGNRWIENKKKLRSKSRNDGSKISDILDEWKENKICF